jgi:hypothetical protein
MRNQVSRGFFAVLGRLFVGIIGNSGHFQQQMFDLEQLSCENGGLLSPFGLQQEL